MRVLVVTQYFWPENFRVNDLVDGLLERGHEVTVLTGLPNYPEGRILPEFVNNPAAFANFKGAEIIRIPILPRRRGALHLALNYLSFIATGLSLGTWKLRGRQFDVVLSVMLSPATAAIPAILQRKLKKAPHLTWVLDLWPESLSAVGMVKSKRLLSSIGKLVGAIYRRTDIVLVQSQAFFQNVRKYGGENTRIEYFPGWPEPVFTGALSDAEDAPEMKGIPGPFKILFAGNIGEAQDFAAILGAVEVLRDRQDIHWVIVGDGRKAEWLRMELDRRNLQSLVSMVGRFPISRMPGFFKSANLLLVSLKSDPIFSMTIPGKVQSYLATGLPIVAMLDGEGARIVEESGAGLTAPAGDSTKLANHIAKLADMDAEERGAMGRLGKAYCDREFERNLLISKLEDWMHDLCAKHRD